MLRAGLVKNQQDASRDALKDARMRAESGGRPGPLPDGGALPTLGATATRSGTPCRPASRLGRRAPLLDAAAVRAALARCSRIVERHAAT